MEKMNEKVTGPPPVYKDDSDVESIIKPAAPVIEETVTKPLPVWQNNALLRTKRRQLVAGGVFGTIVILAIILGVLASQGILAKKESNESKSANYCLKWIYRVIPTPSSDNTYLMNGSNVYCAKTADGVTVVPNPFPSQGNAVCSGWYTSSTYDEVNRANANNKPLTWSCFDWATTTASSTGGGSTASATMTFGDASPSATTVTFGNASPIATTVTFGDASPIATTVTFGAASATSLVMVASGVRWSAGGWLSVVALAVPVLLAEVL